MQKMKCILVDDDEVALLSLSYFIKSSESLELLGAFLNAQEALEFIEKNPLDILFLDIDMPELSGFELRLKAMNVPFCVFISAFGEYALESFGLDTLDFLQKPVKPERFKQTVDKLKRFMDLYRKAERFDTHFSRDHILIKEKQGYVKVKPYDILYMEAYKNYTQIVTHQKEFVLLGSFSSFLEKEAFSSFVRVHKSYAVQKHFIKKIFSSELVLENNKIIPVGRMYKDNLQFLVK